jgi:hypothetical protein
MPENVTQTAEDIRLTILQRTYELMMAAFSLVAALAWNEAIQGLFLRLLGPAQSLLAKFLYAIFLTIVIVYMGSRLSKVTKALEKRLTAKS